MMHEKLRNEWIVEEEAANIPRQLRRTDAFISMLLV